VHEYTPGQLFQDIYSPRMSDSMRKTKQSLYLWSKKSLTWTLFHYPRKPNAL